MPGLLNRILKNMVSPSATRLYPDRVREPFPGCRGDIEADIGKCRLCGKCARTCPTACLSVDKDARTWQRDPFSCVFCGACAAVCPTGSLQIVSRYMRPSARTFTIRHVKEKKEEAGENQESKHRKS